MSLLASLTGTEVGFYAAVATIIPVFVLAYVVALNRILGQTLAPRGARSTDSYVQFLLAVYNRERWGKPAVRALGAFLLATVYQLVIIALFVVAVALPSIGEYAALHALYVDRSASSAKTLGLLGALIAAAIVITPVAWTTLKSYAPFTIWKAMFDTMRQLGKEQEETDVQPTEDPPIASPTPDPPLP